MYGGLKDTDGPENMTHRLAVGEDVLWVPLGNATDHTYQPDSDFTVKEADQGPDKRQNRSNMVLQKENQMLKNNYQVYFQMSLDIILSSSVEYNFAESGFRQKLN